VTGDPDYLRLHAELLEQHLIKSGGYGTGADPLANFTQVAAQTGEPPWRYPRRRMIEKLARCESLDAQGRDGELEEELLDIAGLALCAAALRRRATRKG
jgi:hypothetical protein